MVALGAATLDDGAAPAGGGGTPLPTVAEQMSALSLVPAHLLASFDGSEGEISETSSMEASPCTAARRGGA